MSKSQRVFQRWNSNDTYTWPFQVFRKHNRELTRMYTAHITAHGYTYRKLGESANWKDTTTQHFNFLDPTNENTYKNIQDWSNSFYAFDNWVNLNSIMAMSSNLETYMATVIKLALESDLGLLFGVNNRIDGVEILKYGKQPISFIQEVTSCTKGEWGSRVKSYEKIFGFAPNILKDNISSLEKLRHLRNKVGHSFGRNIEKSRLHNTIDIVPMDKLKREKTLFYQKLIFGISKAVDRQLSLKHIGEYQKLYFYHNLIKSLPNNKMTQNQNHDNRVLFLKKELGRFGAYQYTGKKFCSGLINFYDEL